MDELLNAIMAKMKELKKMMVNRYIKQKAIENKIFALEIVQ